MVPRASTLPELLDDSALAVVATVTTEHTGNQLPRGRRVTPPPHITSESGACLGDSLGEFGKRAYGCDAHSTLVRGNAPNLRSRDSAAWPFGTQVHILGRPLSKRLC